MYSFTKREQILVLTIVFIIISVFGYKVVVDKKSNSITEAESYGLKIEENQENSIEGESIVSEESVNNQAPEDLERDKTIMVHISGQIHNPGLLELKSGDRINDAVILSGGLKNDADIDRINLSQKVQDEEKIYIPKIGEDLEPIQVVESKNNNNLSSSKSSNSENINEKIDINSCSKELLISLPGIGDVTAEKILKYREEMKFQKIEDIMEVSGIGDKKFEAIKDLIVVK